MLIPVFRLAAELSAVAGAQHEHILASTHGYDVATMLDAVEVHFLDENNCQLGDELNLVNVHDVAWVSVMFHHVNGGLSTDISFDVMVGTNRKSFMDSDGVQEQLATQAVQRAHKTALAIADVCRAALLLERTRLGLQVCHLP
jgi:hypothetical protein